MRSAGGFTILELLVAAAISLFVIAGAFVAMNRAHRTSVTQDRAVDLASQARLVMELIGRDIRNAGDSVQFLPKHCLVDPATGAAHQTPGAPFGCPAILEPRSEEHTSELQSRENLVCRLLLEKKKWLRSIPSYLSHGRV